MEARAGDAGVDADDDWEEPEGEPERRHQPIGTRGYGEKSETLVIMEWRKWRRGGRGSLGGETRRRPPPRHLGFFSFSLGGSRESGLVGCFSGRAALALWLSGATRLSGERGPASQCSSVKDIQISLLNLKK